jgi:methionine biosynthesis protein MetW
MVDNSESVRGLSTEPVSALRYDNGFLNPYESAGLLISMIPEKARVLDIGCGTGFLARMMRDLRNADVLGIEPHRERAKEAGNKGITVINGIYTADISKQYGYFDSIVLADVLEHLVDPIVMLEQIKLSLTQNGRVFASIPNVAHWSVRLRLLAGNFDYKPTGIMDATHLRWFTRKGVRRLFEDAGYEIEHFYGAAGGWMGVYRLTPLRFVSSDSRSFILSKLCAVFPGLFSVQHIVAAKVK